MCKHAGRGTAPCMMRRTMASAAARDGVSIRKSSTRRSMAGCRVAALLLPWELRRLARPDSSEKPVGVALCVELALSVRMDNSQR